MSQKSRLPLAYFSVIAMASMGTACSDDHDIDSDEQARRAYLGLDTSIEKSVNLGFDGFNSASSANIESQIVEGDDTGTLGFPPFSGHLTYAASTTVFAAS